MKRLLVLLFALAVLAAACSGTADAPVESTGATSTTATLAPSTTIAPLTTVTLPELPAEPDSDAARPVAAPTAPGGAAGYTHYVFENIDGRIVTSLVEGPAGPQVRCQDPALPCSYLELKELAESGGAIPPELAMTRAELEALVAELDEANQAADQYRDVNAACRAGYMRNTDQTPNMGAHFLNIELMLDGVFNIATPEIVLYGSADPDDPTLANQGQCLNGVWSGGDVVLTGFSYVLPMQIVGSDHPDGFTGPLDNWHIHYELCTGPNTSGRTADAAACAADNGIFIDTYGWMIHAWIDPAHDNQLGAFSMWNNSIWPLTSPDEIRGSRVTDAAPVEGITPLLIENFAFEDVTVRAGDTVRVINADAATHTFTAGLPGALTGRFDSGFIPAGGSYDLTFDQAGSIDVFCSLHPSMVRTITVEP